LIKSWARYEIWKAELQIVKHEMIWTILWFKHYKEEWKRQYKTYLKLGHKAYATKQRIVWKRFMEKAKERFEKNMTYS
jgi:hypothetical protein